MDDAAVVPYEAPDPVGVDVLRYLGYHPADVATKALVMVAREFGLRPLLGEVQLIKPRTGSAKVYVTRNGLLHIAHQSGQLDGITVDEQRRNTQDNGWTAYVSVWRKDCSHPFRYGAQCKDTEDQAKAGNGPEMALARAERRALLRAFDIPDSGVEVEDQPLAGDRDVGGAEGPIPATSTRPDPITDDEEGTADEWPVDTR